MINHRWLGTCGLSLKDSPNRWPHTEADVLVTHLSGHRKFPISQDLLVCHWPSVAYHRPECSGGTMKNTQITHEWQILTHGVTDWGKLVMFKGATWCKESVSIRNRWTWILLFTLPPPRNGFSECWFLLLKMGKIPVS